MAEINDGGPAFPGTEANGLNSGWSGLSLRDYFAAKAMHGLMAMDGVMVGDERMLIPKHAGIVAGIAYQMADAMLRAREGSAS
ncbi:hypothetical protein KBW71_03480 [Hydrogenophaga aromaticivorans]|uniref:hypothetical protein n=1 Tax=Hydrogenophaga aromaticivorans TaxID=2610898 RepID=UPI001B394689|nr:hypothetical protein [Hydrogenophaga aromaticivorans]MBQ0917491.1 hypothetical protein [Hydrogenophaga aromaticivorans]